MPCPLSWIWSNFNPPSLQVMEMEVDPASSAFSSSSLSADAGRCTTSPAAMRLTTTVSSFSMRRGAGVEDMVSSLPPR